MAMGSGAMDSGDDVRASFISRSVLVVDES